MFYCRKNNKKSDMMCQYDKEMLSFGSRVSPKRPSVESQYYCPFNSSTTFGRICNPTASSISICNAIIVFVPLTPL